MPLKLPFFLFILACALLFTCSDDNGNPTYPIERTILDLSIAKRCANCYLLRWQHPYETKDLQSYYVWIGTDVVNDSVQQPSQSQIDGAQKAIPFSNRGSGDSLDLTDLVKDFLDKDSLHIAIWAKYGGSDQGMVKHYYIYFGDDVAPLHVNFIDSASANTIWVSWERPRDQADFYSEQTDGPIKGYNIVITGKGVVGAKLSASIGGTFVAASKIIKFHSFEKAGRKNVPGEFLSTVFLPAFSKL